MAHKILESWIVFFLFMITQVLSKTNSPDVSALNVMFTSLNSPSKLSKWKSSGGDPCGDSWKGIKCSGSSVTEIRLSDLGLTGTLGYQLSSLTSVTYFDLSKNNLKGDIPYQLPPNIKHLDLSQNDFSNNIPYSISQMTDLNYLNLGHNKLNGQVTDMFGKLTELKEMDLSFNSLTDKLPQSFGKLSKLNSLYLQNNKFTGTINVLANLPLDDLNVENNGFTGWIPNELKEISYLKTGGNSWSSGPSPPGHSRQKSGNSKTLIMGLTISAIAIAVLIVIAILISIFSRKKVSYSSHFLDEERRSQRKSFSLQSQELSKELYFDPPKDYKEVKSNDPVTTIDIPALTKSASTKHGYHADTQSIKDKFANRLQHAKTRSTSVRATCFSLKDLQTATSNFDNDNLLGVGTIGRVYMAKFTDGKVLAVKKIDSSLFEGKKEEDFSEVVTKITKLHHQNIAEIVGYCSEQGHNMLIYEYVRNGSLHEFLHLSDDYSRPLTWNTRVKIALGTARAIEYLHEVCSPPTTHKNIKSSNILLDVELNPHLSDCGLDIFHRLTDKNLGDGYSSPECMQSLPYTMKSDVYSFGVVMLELLTGRMPFDSSKPKMEQSLVWWATPQLHDIDALEKMVDPSLRGLYPPKSVSRFADIIALCLQAEPEFRPLVSEVVQSLVQLTQRSNVGFRDGLGASRIDEEEF